MTLDDETAERDVFAHKTDEFVAQWLENDLPKLKRPGFGNTHDMVRSAIRRLRAGYAARDAEVEELRAFNALWKRVAANAAGRARDAEQAANNERELSANFHVAITRARGERDKARAEVEELRAELDILRATEDGNLSAMRERAEKAEATLAKLRGALIEAQDGGGCGVSAHSKSEAAVRGYLRAHAAVLAILDESPTERETPARPETEFRFTDDQWRAYQAIPEQGYSHRGWIENVVNRWLAERETPADEWEYGREYTHMDGSPYRRRVSDEVFREHAPDGHRADGSPYWNYRQLRRRKAGPWGVVPDDRA